MESIQNIIQKTNEENQKKYLTSNFTNKNCELCLNAGACGIWEKPQHEENGYLIAATKVFCSKRSECEKLGAYREEWIKKNKNASGLNELLTKRVQDFKAGNQWQKAIKQMTVDYINDCTEKFNTHSKCSWLMFLGQSGSGKTHLCASISNWLLSQNRRVLYVRYVELSNAISNFDYNLLERAKNIPILYLDDLYKGSRNKLDEKAIFDLIDYRYANDLQTIISCENTSDELLEINEAVIGRIVEKCNGFFFEIQKDHEKNYRLN